MSRLNPTQLLINKLGEPKTIEKKLETIISPINFELAWLPNVHTNKIRVHPICRPYLLNALNDIYHELTPEEIKSCGFDQFGGGYCLRNSRGSEEISAHAFGIAFDFNPKRNSLHNPFKFSTFAKGHGLTILTILENYYFVNYGKQFNYDAMHFEFKL